MNKMVAGFVAAGIAAMLVGCLGVIMLVAALRERVATKPQAVPAVGTPPAVRAPAADPVKRARRPVPEEVEEENPRPIRRKLPRDDEEEAPAPPKAKRPAEPATTPGWQEVTSDEGRFRVRMPGKPVRKNRTMPSPVGPVNDVAYLLDTAERSLLVSYADFDGPGRKDVPLERVIRAGRDEIVKRTRAKVVREQDVMLQGHPGRELVFDIPGQGTGHFRWYAAGRRLYTVGILGIRSSPGEDEVATLFDSFRLTE